MNMDIPTNMYIYMLYTYIYRYTYLRISCVYVFCLLRFRLVGLQVASSPVAKVGTAGLAGRCQGVDGAEAHAPESGRRSSRGPNGLVHNMAKYIV